MKPVVRVTQLESFRRFICGEYDYITEQSVIDNITQEFTGNEYTRIGSAFHKIVELGSLQAVERLGLATRVEEGERSFTYYNKQKTEPTPKGWRIGIGDDTAVLDDEQVATAERYAREYPAAIHEVRTYKEYDDVVVTGCADIINGLEIRDIKTKYSTINDADYINSAQWRFYMELFECQYFSFDLFAFDGYKLEKHGDDVRGLPLNPIQPHINCVWYNKLREDNKLLLKEFLQWVKCRNLEKYLQKEIK